MDKLYKHIQSGLFVLEAQYDTDQIFQQMGAPTDGANPTLRSYVEMYGEAMRNSTAQVLSDAPRHKAPGTDGIFHPSCLKHGVAGEVLQGQTYEPIVADWFFEQGALRPFYRMVEAPSSTGLPVNPGKGCAIPSGPGPSTPTPAPAPDGCAAQLQKDGCLGTMVDRLNKCEKCAEAHEADLKAAGCTVAEAKKLCGN